MNNIDRNTDVAVTVAIERRPNTASTTSTASPNGTSASSAAATTTALVVITSSSVLYAAWRILLWKARLYARKMADRVQAITEDGPMVDHNDTQICRRILASARNRAAKWTQFLPISEAVPLPTQVGGLSDNKRPVLFVSPDYALKPLNNVDGRGVRETAFYETVKLAANTSPSSTAAAARSLMAMRATSEDDRIPESAATGGSWVTKATNQQRGWLDQSAMRLALHIRDPIIIQCEKELADSWQHIHNEIEMLGGLSAFTPSYHGLLGPAEDGSSILGNSEPLSSDSYLLLQDVTVNFRKPCVLDLKMGRRTYEPDVSLEKHDQEISKYPQQEDFGLRLIAMRVYDPSHVESDGYGYRKFDKQYGRSLSTLQQVRNALELYFKTAAVPNAEAILNEESRRANYSQFDLKELEKKWKTERGVRLRVVANLIHQLQSIRKWFEKNTSLRFYASSLLFVYEGDLSVENHNVTTVRMIDFGHVRREAGGDTGYLHGIKTLLGILNEILREGTDKAESD